MDIKLLAVDIDETMVNSHHKMTTVTQQALKKAMEQGITVAVVSGGITCKVENSGRNPLCDFI